MREVGYRGGREVLDRIGTYDPVAGRSAGAVRRQEEARVAERRAGSPERADARRNRAQVLRAAREAFEERGSRTSLGEIARRAGVGAGTVYRHFPSKEALFRATVEDRIRLFTLTARDLAEVDRPDLVFFRFLASMVRVASQNGALSEALAEVGCADAGALPAAERELDRALEVLLERARRAGAVRGDVLVEDVWTLVAGCLAMERAAARRSARTAAERAGGGPSGVPGRATLLAIDALRPGRHVTKLPRKARKRDERACAGCGEPVGAARTGRPARYCGAACRQRAYRTRRRAAGAAEPSGERGASKARGRERYAEEHDGARRVAESFRELERHLSEEAADPPD
ncbi:TetR/AcrR family transcriptional regulator [Streptomyces sp. NPDC059740]|uniref:TetR/AcrR family transcriptional regulator n=1 Tax=Streptomyces sp. NPDC059740 TaxID=3346926 RepID=UPI0036483054